MNALRAPLIIAIALLPGRSAFVSAQVRGGDDGWWDIVSFGHVAGATPGSTRPDLTWAPEWPPAAGRVEAVPREYSTAANGRHVGFGWAPGYGAYLPVSAGGPGPRPGRRCASRRAFHAPGWRGCAVRHPGGWAHDRRVPPGWARIDWGRFGIGGAFPYTHNEVLGPHRLHRLLGAMTMARLHRHALYLGARGELRGRVVDSGRDGVVIQIRAGRIPIAELGDFDRNRWIDLVHLRDRPGHRDRGQPGRHDRGYGEPVGRGTYGYADPVDGYVHGEPRERGGHGYGPTPIDGQYGWGSEYDDPAGYDPTYGEYGLGPDPLYQPALSVSHAEVEGAGVRYTFNVHNWSDFSPELFRPAPDLPPCGLNRSSARTWVDIMDASGNRVYGFCALDRPESLNRIWTFVPHGSRMDGAYIVLTDRLTGVSVASNVVPLQ